MATGGVVRSSTCTFEDAGTCARSFARREGRGRRVKELLRWDYSVRQWEASVGSVVVGAGHCVRLLN